MRLTASVYLLWKKLRYLALCVLMLSVVTPTAGALWMCEGRACGTSAVTCCCAESVAKTDSICDADALQRAHLRSDTHWQEAEPCAQNCHCTMVVQTKDASSRLSSPNVVHYSPVLAVLPPRAFALEVPQSQTLVRSLPSRGPPLRSVFLSFPSLRAPPVA